MKFFLRVLRHANQFPIRGAPDPLRARRCFGQVRPSEFQEFLLVNFPSHLHLSRAQLRHELQRRLSLYKRHEVPVFRGNLCHIPGKRVHSTAHWPAATPDRNTGDDEHMKFEASSMLPEPLYMASCG